MEKLLVVNENGDVTCLYSDDLPALGRQVITRASEVEPDPDGGWQVKLSQDPRNGEHAGRVIARRVLKRADALALEVDFIQGHILRRAPSHPVSIGLILESIMAEMRKARRDRGQKTD